ncbi:MAG: hypothetical protein M1436_05535 [Acidobacteria bacterium]|nr:hypothetical protein [Acidobacteriota bacterium]
MTKKLLLAFATLALTVASAKTYSLTLYQAVTLSGHELQAGQYKVELNGEKVVLRSGRESTEAAVKVETGANKFSSTSVRFDSADGKNRIQEIRLGGTKMKLVVND